MMALFKAAWAFVRGVPLSVWLIAALVAALIWENGGRTDAEAEAAQLGAWQTGIVNVTTAALGSANDKGVIGPIAVDAVGAAITAAGQALRDYRTATAAANAGIAATAADGAARRTESRTQADRYDAAASAAKPKLDALRKTPPPASADTDAAEAIEIGRQIWSSLH